MLQLFNSTLASVIVLAVLLELLAAPFLLLWIALSIRRSLARIADQAQHANARFDMLTRDQMTRPYHASPVDARRAAHTVLGQ